MLRHKIEKFDVRRFMGLLERSKLARYSSFRGSLYFSSRGPHAFRMDFCCRDRCTVPRCLSFKRNLLLSFSTFSARFYSLQRELSLRHLQDDLLLATAFVSELKFILLFNFLIQSHSH